MRDDTPFTVPMAMLPIYGPIRITNRPPAHHVLTEHVLSLRRDVYNLTTDEFLAVLATDAVQSLVQQWRLHPADSPIWIEVDRILRQRGNDIGEMLDQRKKRLDAWEVQRMAAMRCSGAVMDEMDRRALRGMVRQLCSAGPEEMPASVQIYKWGHELASRTCREMAHGFDTEWDFELTALVFGEEIELELRYIDPVVSVLLDGVDCSQWESTPEAIVATQQPEAQTA